MFITNDNQEQTSSFLGPPRFVNTRFESLIGSFFGIMPMKLRNAHLKLKANSIVLLNPSSFDDKPNNFKGLT